MFRDAVTQKRQVRMQGDGHIECLRKIIRFSNALTLVSTGSARPPETDICFSSTASEHDVPRHI